MEHAFQAAKCVKGTDKEKVRNASTPKEAKQIGRRIELRADWEAKKEDIMEHILRIKFRNKDLLELLNKTKGYELVEENIWHDNHWGDCQCTRAACQRKGKNILGILLMKIRDEEPK